MNKKKTVADIKKKKVSRDKITMLTAYDAGFARMLEECDVDMLLVGDSLGMVLLGHDSTVQVTMDEMIHHAKAVRRGAPRSLVVGDMPFLSYQVSHKQAIENAGRFLKEAGCDAVKLEGGLEVCDTVVALVKAGIPVIGHIGLTPQTAGQLGGYKVQGKDIESAKKLIESAKMLEHAGVFAIVLECIPAPLAQVITDKVSIPSIGIGAGAGCDGQVLVIHDMLGIFDKSVPSFVKQYTHLAPLIREAVMNFTFDVRAGEYPDDSHSFSMAVDVSTL